MKIEGRRERWRREGRRKGREEREEGEEKEREEGVAGRGGRVGNCIISDAFRSSRAVRVRKLRYGPDLPFRILVRDSSDHSHAIYRYAFCKR